MNRLFADIETSPCVGLFWGAGYKQDISHDQIIKEREIITIAWKWEGMRQVGALTWDENQSDKDMLRQFVQIMGEADEVVAHFGDGFDFPWLRTRCLFHRINFPLIRTVDTKQWASKYFYFNSNKLDYIAKFLGFGGKIKTDYSLWKDIVLKQCPIALRKMVRYNKKDVVLLEKCWKEIQLYVPPKTHVGVLAGYDRMSCPRCGSNHTHVNKRSITASGVEKHKLQCQQCGGYFTVSDSVIKKHEKDEKESIQDFDSDLRSGTALINSSNGDGSEQAASY